MVSQITGAGLGAVVVLGYLLVVQTMTAAIVLLAQFIVVQVRALLALVASKPTPEREPAEPQGAGEGKLYRLGGDVRW